MGDAMILAGGFDLVGLLVRNLFAFFDSIVYWLLIKTYNLLIDISSVNIFGESTLSDFGTRIYTILGVIMLFKLSFSVITYIIDPDKLSDGKNGFQSIVKNIVIMLVLIVATPFVFKYAMALQYVVVKDNTIGRLITGRSGSTNVNAGENMAVSILSGFIRPDESITECADVGLNPGDNTACRDKLNQIEANLGNTYYAAFAGQYKNEYENLIEAGKSTAKVNGKYAITYNAFLSTLAGGFTAYIFLLFCIDIAVRTVKLAFLELIAPIPIVTYMDNGGKDGVFKKWLKECTGTYISLFVRLAAIQFGIYIISAFIIDSTPQICTWSFKNGSDVLTSNCNKAGFIVVIFLILGTLSFVQQLPKLIENITGLKLEGGFSLSPKKILGSGALVGAGVGAAGAAIGSAAGNLWAGGRNLHQNWKANEGNLGKRLGGAVKDTFGMLSSGVAGGVSGGFRGIYAGATGKNKDNPFGNISTGMKGAMDARNLRDKRQLAGDGGVKGVARRAGVSLRNAAGITSGADKYENELAAYDSYLSKQGAIDKLIESEIEKGKSHRKTTFEWKDIYGNQHYGDSGNVNVLKQEIESLKNNNGTAEQIQNAEYRYKAALKQAKIDYVNESFNLDADGKWIDNKTGVDSNIATQVRHMVEDMDYTAAQNSSYAGLSGETLVQKDADGKITNDIGKAWDSAKGKMHGAKDNVTSSEDYKQAMANKKMDSKK